MTASVPLPPQRLPLGDGTIVVRQPRPADAATLTAYPTDDGGWLSARTDPIDDPVGLIDEYLWVFAERRYDRVLLEIATDNHPSQRVAQKLGFTPTRREWTTIPATGQHYEHWTYELTPNDSPP